MGLTNQSTGTGVLENDLRIEHAVDDKIITLAGNPNVGKSTVFNRLTGLNQHTGNWPGKTVSNAQGKFMFRDKNFVVVDVPGTYSLMANSLEEEVARDFICFGRPDATIVVTDATCLERNLNLVLQTLEITDKVVVCVNLIDEAKRKKIHIDYEELSAQLGVPVVPTSARSNKGLNKLMSAVYDVTNKQVSVTPYKVIYDDAIEQAVKIIEPKIWELVDGKINNRWVALKLLDGDENILNSLNKYLGFNLLDNPDLAKQLKAGIKHLEDNGINREKLRDIIVSKLIGKAEEISSKAVSYENKLYNLTDRKIDRILTSKIYGFPVMLGLLAFVFWLTIEGSNIPSQIIASFLFWIEDKLLVFFKWVGTPSWVYGLLVMGIYRTTAWVVSVMLPPMAIFFPLFTLLEDLGYLPRVAFNLDNFFKKACAHGKQALTMCMVKQKMQQWIGLYISPLYGAINSIYTLFSK